MPHNFSNTPFQGDLWDLINECKQWLPNRNDLTLGQRWVFASLNEPGNILPVRKFAPFTARGSQIESGGKTFVAVDNEPFTGFYKILVTGGILLPFNELFGSRDMPASWILESTNYNGWRTGGVKLASRGFGIKLAHLIDAAKGLEGFSSEIMQHRFLLGFSPYNIFPFPDSRKVLFRAEHSDDYSSGPLCRDPAEDPMVQEVLRGFLRQHFCDEELWKTFCSLTGRRLDEGVDNNWEYTATCIKIETTPRANLREAA